MTLHVLVVGGGVAALEAALALKTLAAGRVSVELVAPERRFSYRPMAVGEPFGLGAVREFALTDLAEAAGAALTVDRITAVDASRHTAYTPTRRMSYDVLLVACGVIPSSAVAGALTFRGPPDTAAFAELLRDVADGTARRVAFAVPWGATWTLPIYELALLTAAHVSAHRIRNVDLTVVTPEHEPAELFGPRGSGAIRDLLAHAGVAVQCGVYPVDVIDGSLRLLPRAAVGVDRVVALPRLVGPRIDGLPQTVQGFIPTDEHGRVPGLPDVFAAGDVTTSSVKQGGIAAQQADAAAEAIAAAAGADVTPQSFRPVLRGLLLTGQGKRFLRHELASAADASAASLEPLWWPPAKIAARHLAPLLASLEGADVTGRTEPDASAVAVDVQLHDVEPDAVTARRLREAAEAASRNAPDAAVVLDVMSSDPLVVAPHESVHEVAKKMRERGFDPALVAEDARLVGIVTSGDLGRALAGDVDAKDTPARAWMTADPVAVASETPVGAALTLMREYGVRHLPVVDDGRPIGLVSDRDARKTPPGRRAERS